MASVIDLLTGLPVDFEVLSNYCLKCKMAENVERTDEWRDNHSLKCTKNFDGTSNAMEVECAKRLWGRSIEKFNLRYTTMLCGGDSKSFDAVKDLQVYGENVVIQKEDCINHISKRMGTALRKIVESSKAAGSSISGRGKLTQDKIAKIQNYYGKAVKENCNDLPQMKKRNLVSSFLL